MKNTIILLDNNKIRGNYKILGQIVTLNFDRIYMRINPSSLMKSLKVL